MQPRIVLVASLLVALTACGLPSLRSRAQALGAKTVARVQPLVASARVDVGVDLQAVAAGALRTKARHRLAAPRPIAIDKTARPSSPAPQRVRPGLAPASAPLPVTTRRTTVVPPDVFLLTGVTYGGKEICQEFRSIEVCTRSCLDQQRLRTPGGDEAQDPDSVKHCACGDYDRGC